MSRISLNKSGLMTSAKTALIAGAAALAFTLAPAANASEFGDISIEDFNLNLGDEDLLDGLIAMDADEIAELRAELAEARVEIAGAIQEIEDARAEAAKSKEAAAILAVALSEASKSVEETVAEAFDEARQELNRAEGELIDMKPSISSAEFEETSALIAYLRSELVEIETALGDLVAAMKA